MKPLGLNLFNAVAQSALTVGRAWETNQRHYILWQRQTDALSRQQSRRRELLLKEVPGETSILRDFSTPKEREDWRKNPDNTPIVEKLTSSIDERSHFLRSYDVSAKKIEKDRYIDSWQESKELLTKPLPVLQKEISQLRMGLAGGVNAVWQALAVPRLTKAAAKKLGIDAKKGMGKWATGSLHAVFSGTGAAAAAYGSGVGGRAAMENGLIGAGISAIAQLRSGFANRVTLRQALRRCKPFW